MTESSAQAVRTASALNREPASDSNLRAEAERAARSCSWISGKRKSRRPRTIYRDIRERITKLESELYALRSEEPSDDLRWLYDNFRLIRTDLESIHDSLRSVSKMPGVKTTEEDSIPRVIVLARALLAATGNKLNEKNFSEFVAAVEEVEPLRYAELGGMLDGLKFALLEEVAELGPQALVAFRAQQGRAEPGAGQHHHQPAGDWTARLAEHD